MKEISFLTKLKKEYKLKLVEPSEEIRKSYILKSESNLISAMILLNNNKFEECVGLAYYSMYNLLTALLFKAGIKCENHTGSIIILKEIFGQNNEYILYAKKERIDKQYYVGFSIAKDEVMDTIKKTEEFNNSLFDFISKLNSDDIKLYRKRFMEIIAKI